MEAFALLIIALCLGLAIHAIRRAFRERDAHATAFADTDNDSDYTSEVAKNTQQSNLGEPP